MEEYFERYRKSEVTETSRVICTPSEIAKRTFFYIQEAGYLKSLKPHLGTRSSLDSYLYLIVLSGKGTIICNGCNNKSEHFQANAQDCFLIDCHKEYSHISSPQHPWELMWLHFNSPLASFYYRYIIQKNGNRFQTSYIGPIIDAIHQIIDLNKSSSENAELLTSQLITNILTWSVSGHLTNSSIHTSIKEKLTQVLDYMEQHFTEPITLDSLSGHFFISKYHLSREFKKEYGQTIVQYLLNKRVTYSKELLRFTDMSISEIARACGIGEPNYFNKVFKGAEGMTASEYRKKW